MCTLNCVNARPTSCARGDTICPAPLLPVGAQVPRAPPSRRNVAVLSHAEYVPTLTALRVKAALNNAAWWPWPLTFWPWKWCPCDVGYLCANFCLPRPLCSWVRPDVRDRETDVGQKHRLMPPPIGGGGIITCENTTSRAGAHCQQSRGMVW